MANSTTNIDPILPSQASKEVTANAFFDAASQGLTYGRRASTSTGLTWGYYGGNVRITAGTLSQIANGTIALTASTTNYVVALKGTGAVSVSTATTNWNNSTLYWRLYSIVTGASTVTSWTDARMMAQFTQDPGGGGGSAAWGEITGTLSDQTDLQAALDAKEAVLTAGTNISIDRTDPDNPVISASGGGGGGAVDSVVAGDGISVNSTDPANPIVSNDGVITVTAGTNVTVDDTDPQNIIISASGGGGVSDGDKGDITVSGSGATWTIDNGVVTYAKMQDVSATSRVLGRITALAGDVEELTGANVRTIAGLATTDSPEFAALNVGAASDTTITRSAAGSIAVEGSLVYQRNNIIGPVSQSSAVPTGAIIERGSNANGEYTMFADGTMTCTSPTFSSTTSSAQGSIFIDAAPNTWTFPAVFSAAPKCSGFTIRTGGSGVGWIGNLGASPTTTNMSYRLTSSNTGHIADGQITAHGRWF